MGKGGKNIIGKGETLLELLKMIESEGSATPNLIYKLAVEKCEEISEMIINLSQKETLINNMESVKEEVETTTPTIDESSTNPDNIVILEAQPTLEIEEIGCSCNDIVEEVVENLAEDVQEEESNNTTPFLSTSQSDNDDIFAILANREKETLNTDEPTKGEYETESETEAAIETETIIKTETIIDCEAKIESVTETKSETVTTPTPQKKARLKIKKIISINDLFLFKRELFYNDNTLMDSVFNDIDNMESFSDADSYLTSRFNWDREEGSVAYLLFKAIEEQFKEN